MSFKRKLQRQKRDPSIQDKLRASGFGGQDIQFKGQIGESMSDALSTVISIHMGYVESKAAFEKLVVIGMVAWNAAASKPEDGKKLLESFYEQLRASGGGLQETVDAKSILDELMDRKRLLYPNNNRLIVDYTIKENRNQYHLQVASTPENIS